MVAGGKAEAVAHFSHPIQLPRVLLNQVRTSLYDAIGVRRPSEIRGADIVREGPRENHDVAKRILLIHDVAKKQGSDPLSFPNTL